MQPNQPDSDAISMERMQEGKRTPRVWGRVDLNQDFEVRYWARKLGIAENELRDIVKDVGPIVERVRERLLELKRPT